MIKDLTWCCYSGRDDLLCTIAVCNIYSNFELLVWMTVVWILSF